MKSGFPDFKIQHFLGVLAAGVTVRFFWRALERSETRHDLFAAIRHRPAQARWLYIEKYPSGEKGIVRTLQIMRELVRNSAGDPAIRQFADRIATKCAGHQFGCEVKSLFEFVRDGIKYRRDPSGWEWVQDARRTIETGFGDCDDKSVLLASLLSSIGHRSRFVVIGTDSKIYSHVYIEVWNSRGWVALDPTNERATVGWEAAARAKGTYEIF